MTKFLTTVTICLLCLIGVQSASAKSAIKKVCDGVYFEGEVKKKKPIGEGKLLIGSLSGSIISISGNFEDNKIYNGSFSNGELVFRGLIEYNLSSNKYKSTYHLLEIKFLTGSINGVPISNMSPINISLGGAVIANITMDPFRFNSNESPKYGGEIKSVVGNYISCSVLGDEPQQVTYILNLCYDYRSRYERYPKFYITFVESRYADGSVFDGQIRKWPNGDYMSYNKYCGGYDLENFQITLKDGAIITPLKRNNNNKYGRFNVKLLDGAEYNGSIMFEEGSPYNTSKGKACCDSIEKIISIKSLSSSDLKFYTGKMESPDGSYKRYESGTLHNVIDMQDPYLKKLPKYSDVIRGKLPLDEHKQRFMDLCEDDCFSFVGKRNLDELDKSLYEGTDEYKRNHQEFIKQKQTEFYRIVDVSDSWFTLTNFEIRINYFRTLYSCPGCVPLCDNYCYIPEIKSDSKNSRMYTYCINESNLDALKILKENQNSLKMLIVVKPGFEENHQWCFAQVTALYLINANTNTNTILYDLSSHITELSKAGLKAAKDKANANIKSWTKNIRHHSTPKEQMCFRCGGKGYIVVSGSRKRCTNCYGRGYNITYDY